MNAQKIIKYGVGIYVSTIGAKFLMLNFRLKHFKLSEFRGKWIYLATGLLLRLDKFRDMLGIKVRISPAAGAMIPTSDTTRKETSQHFLGRAIDVIIYKNEMLRKNLDIVDVIETAKEAGFTGIGLYPDSAGDENRIRLHLDIRIAKEPGKIALWGTTPGNDKNYVSIWESAKYV